MQKQNNTYDPHINAPFYKPMVSAELGDLETDSARIERLGQKVMTFTDNPDMLVKIQNEDSAPSVDEQIEVAHTAMQLFEEIKGKYHIATPPINIVVGGKQDEPETWVQTKKVHGIRLKELLASQPSDEIVAEVASLYTKLVTYLTDKRNNGEMFLSDIFHNKQYVYGKTDTDTQNQLYEIDFDFYLGPANVDKDEECQTGFINAANNLTFAINEATDLTGNPFGDARTQLVSLLGSIKPLTDGNDQILKLLLVAAINKQNTPVIPAPEN